MTPGVAGSTLHPLGAGFHAGVRRRLRERAEAAGLDGLLLLAPGNVRYATGWHFSVNERPVGLWLPVEGEPLLLVPLLELENADSVAGVTVRTYEEFPGTRPPVLWMIEMAGGPSTGAGRGSGTAALGPSGLRLAVDALDAALLEPARALVGRLDLVDHVRPERSVKTAEELGLIREAARFADLVLERLLEAGPDIVAAGGTEADLMGPPSRARRRGSRHRCTPDPGRPCPTARSSPGDPGPASRSSPGSAAAWGATTPRAG